MSFSDLQLIQRKERRRLKNTSGLSTSSGEGSKSRSRSLDLSPAATMSSGGQESSAPPPPLTRRLDKNVLMRSKMAAPPSSMSRKGSMGSFGSSSRMCRLNSSSASMCRLNSSNASLGGTLNRSNASMCRLGSSNASIGRMLSSNASIGRMSSVTSFQSSASSGNSSSSSLFRGNSVMQVAQRSNGSAVKQVIQEVQQTIDDYQDQKLVGSHDDEEENSDAAPPVSQMAMLAQWASVDAYYKVVIAKYEGIPVIIAAMDAYQTNVDIQSYGCTALQHLNNKLLIQQHGGVSAMIRAMKLHATNITVQSEALQAIQRQGPKLLSQDKDMLRDQLFPALEHAKVMFLTKAGKDACVFLLQFVTAVTNTSPTTVRECVSGVNLGIATSS